MFEAGLILHRIRSDWDALWGSPPQPQPKEIMFRLYWCLPLEQGGQNIC